MIGALFLVGIGGAFGTRFATHETKTIIIEKPPKVITKTRVVQDTKTVTKRVPYFPESCTEVIDKYLSLNKSVTQYEEGIGAFQGIQNQAVKDIFNKDFQGLNKRQEELSQVKIKTGPALQAMMEDEKVIEKKSQECKEALK